MPLIYKQSPVALTVLRLGDQGRRNEVTNHPNRSKSLTASAIGTLRYFRRGFERDPDAFWIDHDQSARSRVPGLLKRGLIERNSTPGIADLYRITAAGRDALETA